MTNLHWTRVSNVCCKISLETDDIFSSYDFRSLSLSTMVLGSFIAAEVIIVPNIWGVVGLKAIVMLADIFEAVANYAVNDKMRE